MLGQDILKNHREFEFATPRRVSREATRERDDGSNNNSIVSDAAMLKLMESVKNQIALFESTTKGYKNLISALMTRLKETTAKGGVGNRELIEQLERERDSALAEVADQKQMLAEQNRQVALASKNSAKQAKEMEAALEKLSAQVGEAKAGEARAKEALEQERRQNEKLAQQVKELSARLEQQPAREAPRRAQSKSQIDRESRDLEVINRKLAAELRLALAGEAKANEARAVAENKIETMRIEMGSMIKAARQGSTNSLPGSPAATTVAAANSAAEVGVLEAEVKKLREELASEKQQSAMLRKNVEARSKEASDAADLRRAKDELEGEKRAKTALQALLAERVRELDACRGAADDLKKAKEELAAERKLCADMRREISERNREALAAKSDTGEIKKARDDLERERALTGGLRREIGELRKALDAASENATKAAKLSDALLNEQQLVAALRSELAERTRAALSDKTAQVAQAGRGVPELNKNEAVAREREIERLTAEVARLGTLLGGKDKTIADLSIRLAESHAASGPVISDKLDSRFDALEKKHDKLDADMELMEENLTLQANLAEKDELIDKLKKELKALKK